MESARSLWRYGVTSGALERYNEPFFADKRRSSTSSTRGRVENVAAEQIVIGLPPSNQSRAAISNDHHRGSGREIVIACHGKTVGAGHRHGQQVTRVELRQ